MERELVLYYYLRLVREYEERIAKLTRMGKILGGAFSGIGQEATVVGTCWSLREDDFVFPLHRDLGVFLVKGVDPNLLMAQLLGKKTGFSKGKDSFLNAGDLTKGVVGATSMLGATLPVAVGAALAFKLRKEDRVALAFFGEGASSRGDVHEAMNFAGLHKLPVLFICENNAYAFSTPQKAQMAVNDVADRAEGYGFEGVVCSGNDLNGVMKVTSAAIEKARNGGGPTLIECKTYRYHGHSEHDRPIYRTEDELIEWESRDPILIYEMFLKRKGFDLEKVKKETEAKITELVDQAVNFAEESDYPSGAEAMDDLYAGSPKEA